MNESASTPQEHMTEEKVREALSRVLDPELGKDLVSLGMIKDVSVDGSKVSFSLVLTTPACPLKSQLEQSARHAVLSLPGVKEVIMNVTSSVVGRRIPEAEALLPGVKNIVAVASGKGGVGKSTVAVNIAVALAETGARVGLLDADIYGPTIPLLMGVNKQPEVRDGKLIPVFHDGIHLMSLGFLLSDSSPVIWRGPLVAGAVKQLLGDVRWGELDYLIVDLPPGTGDAQLTLAQSVPLTGVVIVMTPQDVALVIASKALAMFRKMNVPVLGVVENMSYFICPECGKRSDIFNHGGGMEVSKKLGVSFLGEVPLESSICVDGDEGTPTVSSHPNSPQAEAFKNIACATAAQISMLAFRVT
ncbi:MAG: Mrp/NBP35 family ATP-binding protein [Candidatus Eisenbacteria bacterium]|nr:Mrp/NBP35 family ATP-binding protein [Candidatus Eisenbacteria bacterium]